MPTLRECMDRTILPWDYQQEEARGRYGTLVFGGDWNQNVVVPLATICGCGDPSAHATPDHVAVIDRQERAWQEGTRRFISGRIAAALTVCDQVEAHPIGWGGPMAVSLARTIREALTRPIPPAMTDPR